ncbi:GMC oxidoreductase-domain-containing protein [Ampelomyces quisqualis]|uniref:GMC oxidoreductase-domain-containing protein n=1 Tax=Ampelomyces quisqualis TaxID=50730 RepID=A0A6A5QJV5_AMPQU|nr:GMC oxidoreductase-domain-containing protein [Ampelomyces quisqualis]
MVQLPIRSLCAASLVACTTLAQQNASTYDYIIVGGGTADSVLVVEYGPLNNDSSILLPSETLVSHADRYYNITSVPIPGLLNVTRPVLAGAIVGGGSAVNGMFFDRGSASDYDAWETLGNPGWGFQSLLPYFNKGVTFTPPSAQFAEMYNYTWDIGKAYGGQGEVQVSFPPYQFPGQEYVWNAWNELGIKKPDEAAGGEAVGAIQAPSALDPVTRTRSYARTTHYDGVPGIPSLERPLSRGTININTSDPANVPIVDYGTFSNPLDIAVAIPLVTFARKFNKLNAFANLGATEISPGANVTSETGIAEFLRRSFAPTAADIIKERTEWA